MVKLIIINLALCLYKLYVFGWQKAFGKPEDRIDLMVLKMELH